MPVASVDGLWEELGQLVPSGGTSPLHKYLMQERASIAQITIAFQGSAEQAGLPKGSMRKFLTLACFSSNFHGPMGLCGD